MDSTKILDIELYMDKHKKEIVDYIEDKITKKKIKEVKMKFIIYDRIVNKLAKEMPYGPRWDNTHVILTDALITSLWCGWLSKAMVNKGEPNFSKEYPDMFKRTITKAFEIGQKYASERP